MPSENTAANSPDSPETLGYSGPRRVLFERVQPAIEAGLFPVKRPLNEPIAVEAWVLADGHDLLAVRLCHRPRFSPTWSETPMRLRYNDEWLADFQPDRIGFWEYSICAWVDRFLTWRAGFEKKTRDLQDPSIELLVGAGLVEDAATRAKDQDAQRLQDWAAVLRDVNGPSSHRVTLALSEELSQLVHRYPDRRYQAWLPRWIPVLIERERAYFSAWYEFFPRSWGDRPGLHGTFRSAQRLLPEIARLGFDIVYLPPIHPIGVTFRKGKNNALCAAPGDVGSPWAIGSALGGHKSINPDLGTLQDFQDFIWRAGELGLEVAMDVAFQCSPDHPYVKEHPSWFRWRPDGSVQYAENPPKKYQDILPFDFESEDWPALWQELKSIFTYWIDKGVKIFRVDNPHTKPLEFWRWLITDIKETHPEAIFLAEAFTRPKIKYRLAKAGFTQGYTYFTWRNTKEELTQYLRELTQTEVADFFLPNFWPNTPDILHDFLVHGGRPAHIIRLVLAATLSSNYGVYGPAFELCEREPFPGKEEYNHNEKYEIKQWEWDRPGNLKGLYSRLNRIRRDNPAFQRTRHLRFVETDNPNLLAYLKIDPRHHGHPNTMLVVVNLDPHHTQSGWVDLPLDHLGLADHQPFVVQDLLPEFTGPVPTAVYRWQGSRNFVKLDPTIYPAHIFKVLHDRPDSPV